MKNGKLDRRVERTKQSLHQALMMLMRGRKYDSIRIADILESANVGRSTFYMHFQDKDELLLDGVNHLKAFLYDALVSARSLAKNDYERVIGFSYAMFAHAHENRDVYHSLLGGNGWEIIRSRLESVFSELIIQEANAVRSRFGRQDAPLELFVQTLSVTFWTVMTWWMVQRVPLEPKKVDEYFRALVTPGLQARFG